MPDIFTVEKRSQVMSQIRARGNKETEIVFARLLRKQKITGWRRHYRVFGKPDFVFLKLKVAVFVDGCFWHGCPKHSNMPANNRAFWRRKLGANRRRDLLVIRTLRKAGWRTLRVWEHDLAAKNRAHLLRRLRRVLGGQVSVQKSERRTGQNQSRAGWAGGKGDG